jgi:hypothetical protein
MANNRNPLELCTHEMILILQEEMRNRQINHLSEARLSYVMSEDKSLRKTMAKNGTYGPNNDQWHRKAYEKMVRKCSLNIKNFFDSFD